MSYLSRPSCFYYEVTTLRKKNGVKLELTFHFFAFVFPYCAPMALCKLGKYFLPKVHSLAQMRSGWFFIILEIKWKSWRKKFKEERSRKKRRKMQRKRSRGQWWSHLLNKQVAIVLIKRETSQRSKKLSRS